LPFSVDLPPESEAAQANQVVLSACDEALRPRRCELSTSAEPARARVRWATPLSAWIDEWDGQRWRRQTLLFTEEDTPDERFRAVGLVLAALASEGRAPSQEAPQAPRTPRPTVGMDLGAAFLSGPGLASGHWRAGLATTFSARLSSWPLGLRANVSASAADTADSASDAVWLCASAGPYGAYEPFGWLRLATGVDFGWEWLSVTMRDAESDAQRQTRAYLTIRPWVAASVWLNRWLGLRAGAEFYTTPGQTLRIDGEFIGQNHPFGLLGVLGVELRLAK